WRTHPVQRSRAGLQATQLDDLDGVVLVPMDEDDVSIDDMKPPPLPDLQVQDKQEGPRKFPALDGMGSSSPRIAKMPNAEGLEDGKRSLTGEVIATPGMELSLPKSTAKAGKNKRWLKGRGATKRRKLEENSRLEKWLEQNGVWLSETASWGQPAAGVSMAVETREQTENEVSGRGLVARRDIEQYEDLARVPQKLLLTKEQSREIFGEECISSSMSEYPAIALQLIHEKFVMKEESFWAPYISVLPSTEEIGASFSWPDEELDTLLNGSISRNMSIYLKDQVREEFEKFQATIFQKFPDKFPSDAFTHENYVWAYAVLFSRAVRLDFPDGPDEEDMVALVPYIDLINHNPNSESRIRGVSEGADVPGISSTERYVVVRSDRYYNKYEQIYISYGRKSNAQLLMLYGFSMERNTQDFVTISAGQLMETSPFADVKKKILEELEVPPEGVFPLYRDRFTGEMMMYLRLAILQPADLDLDDDASPNQVYKALKQLDIKRATGEVSERGALICLRGIIQELQDAYPTTLQEDEALIRDRQMFELLPKNQRNALRVRYGEKLIFRASLATIDRTLNNLPRLGQLEKEKAKRYQEMENSAFGRLSVRFESPFKARNLEELMKELDI
ncbi:LSMT-L, partial [Symbiodinium pilosum]